AAAAGVGSGGVVVDFMVAAVRGVVAARNFAETIRSSADRFRVSGKPRKFLEFRFRINSRHTQSILIVVLDLDPRFKKTTYQVEEEPANFALMAILSSSSSDNEDYIIVLTNKVEAIDNYIITLKQKLSQAKTERDDLKLKFDKFQTSSKSLTSLLANQTNGKHDLRYSSLENDPKSASPSCPSDRVQPSGGYNAIPPQITGNFMPPKPDLVFHTAPIAVETDHSAFTIQLSLAKPAEDLSHTNRPSAPTIEECVSDSETTDPQIPHSSVQSTKQETPPMHYVQPVEAPIPAVTPKPTCPKTSCSGKKKDRKTCFVCRSRDHLIKDCKFHDKPQTKPSPRNYAHRDYFSTHKTYQPEEEPANFALMVIPSSSSSDNELSPAKPTKDLSNTNRPSAPIIEEWVSDSETTAPQIAHCSVQGYNKQHASFTKKFPQKHIVPAAMLPKSKPVSVTAVRPIYADVPKIMMTRPRQAHYLNTRSNSTIRRHKTCSHSSNTSNSSPKVTVANAPMVSAAKGKKGKWVWRPKCPILDHDSRTTESSTSSLRHSPPTSPQYSPFNFSLEPSPRWTPETMSRSTPGLFWEIHNNGDGFPGLLHEYWAEGNTMEVDHAEEELIPVERLVATSSIMDGPTPQGVEVINNTNNGDNTNGINNELNEVRFDGCSCSICYEACTSGGKHQICCLPCGHVYGLSCIQKWLPLHQDSNKCPQCKRSCTLQDVRLLYVTSQPTDDHETSLKALKLRVSTPEQRDDALEKLPTELEQYVHALEECVYAIEESLQQVNTGTRKRAKYMAKCAGIGYGFLPLSFLSSKELEADAVTLLKWIRKFSMA
nr:E3 ubiquitin-protein ligase RFWD3-like [Tanacetum cinerariifolium]